MSAAAVMVLSVMIAPGIRIIFQRSGSKGLCRRVRGSLYAGIESDPGIRQGHLGAHPDTAADQRIHFGRLQESRQRAMSASVCIDHLFPGDLSVLRIIELELL